MACIEFGEPLTKLEVASYKQNQAWKKTNVNRKLLIFEKKWLKRRYLP